MEGVPTPRCGARGRYPLCGTGSGRLRCLAPGGLGEPLIAALAAAGTAAIADRRRSARLFAGPAENAGNILTEAAGEGDALLVVTPPHWAPGDLAVGPVIGDVPVGLIQAAVPDDLVPFAAAAMRAPSGRWAVLAQWAEHYPKTARRLARRMAREGSARVGCWLADDTSAAVLCRRLARHAPDLAIYLGHGRPYGFAGYRELRWPQVAAVPLRSPAGTVLALACDTVRRPAGGALSFGESWVASGRAAAYVGAVAAIASDADCELARLAGDLIAAGSTIGQLMLGLWRASRGDPALETALSQYRLLGNPLTSLAR